MTGTIISPEVWCKFWTCIPGPRGSSKGSSTCLGTSTALLLPPVPTAGAAALTQSSGPGRCIPWPTCDQWPPGWLPYVKHMHRILGLDPAVSTALCSLTIDKSLCVTAGICVQVKIWFMVINIIKGPTLHCGVILAPGVNENVAVEFNESMGPPLPSVQLPT